MQTTWEARADDRFDHAATILIENHRWGVYLNGRLVNYGAGGASVQCSRAYAPGTPLVFSIETPPPGMRAGVYQGHVKWCRELPEKESLYDFGMGVAYVKPDLSKNLRRPSRSPMRAPHLPDGQPVSKRVQPSKTAAEQGLARNARGGRPRRIELRRFLRQPFGRTPLYIARRPIGKAFVKDIGKGGMLIETADEFDVGEQLIVFFPAHRRRDLTVQGVIVRVDADGTAIRFERTLKH